MDRHLLGNDLLTVEIRALGAAINRLVAHTSDGHVDLLLGHAYDADRATSTYYLGELVGPTANRVADGRFTLDGIEHVLATNDRGNSLHGGPDGFSKRLWRFAEATDTSATLTLDWADATGGHPGSLTASVTFTLDGPDITHVITVTTDKPTFASPCLHPYFNLAGTGTIADHVLGIDADHVLFIDDTGIPLPGDPAEVAGSPLDLRGGVRLGDVLDADHPQMTGVGGIDHAYVLNAGSGPAVVLIHPETGRTIEMWTDRPSMQVFTGTGLDEDTPGLAGVPYPNRGGVALEAQGFPNAANRPDYPSTRIDADHPFVATTRWRISASSASLRHPPADPQVTLGASTPA